MKIIKGQRPTLERELLETMFTPGAEGCAANLKARLARRGKGKLVLASKRGCDTVPAGEATSDSEI